MSVGFRNTVEPEDLDSPSVILLVHENLTRHPTLKNGVFKRQPWVTEQ